MESLWKHKPKVLLLKAIIRILSTHDHQSELKKKQQQKNLPGPENESKGELIFQFFFFFLKLQLKLAPLLPLKNIFEISTYEVHLLNELFHLNFYFFDRSKTWKILEIQKCCKIGSTAYL